MKERMLAAIAVSMSLWMIFACSQKYQGELLPVQDESTGKWGYTDTIGKSVIAPKWDVAGIFSEGLAAVETDGKWGFINRNGIESIPVKYDAAFAFSGENALVALDRQWGKIDKTGKVFLPLEFDSIGTFSEGLAKINSNGKWGYMDTAGKEAIPAKYDKVEPFSGGLASVELDDKAGVIDISGKVVVPFQFKGLQKLIGVWSMKRISFHTDPNDVEEISMALGVPDESLNKEDHLLSFQEEGIFHSGIDMSDGSIFKNGKATAFKKNNKWQCDNFVKGESGKNNFIFSCDLKLSLESEDLNYKLFLETENSLRIEVFEKIKRDPSSVSGYMTKGGIVPMHHTLTFIRQN
ncbi:MAG: WG repeat-containing protein [Tannerella sp.]|jgi:hypothetical protein|nr:WG repeat-containing protein [Tannerella sp.]